MCSPKTCLHKKKVFIKKHISFKQRCDTQKYVFTKKMISPKKGAVHI